MNVYLDINGVILTKNHIPAYFLNELLIYLTSHHTVYWLTTHCKGDSTSVVSYLSQFLDEKTLQHVKAIRPTTWNTLKTEAIDFSSKFIWLDDYVMDAEKEILQNKNVIDSWIPIDLEHNPQQLKSVYNALV